VKHEKAEYKFSSRAMIVVDAGFCGRRHVWKKLYRCPACGKIRSQASRGVIL
jgi:hypothetical protein